MRMNLAEEANQLLDHVRDFRNHYRGRGQKWAKHRRDAYVRIVEHYLEKHLPETVKLIRYGFLRGCSTQFDFLVVETRAEPERFTNMYEPDEIRALIEVKGDGFYRAKADREEWLRGKDEKVSSETHKPTLYLVLWESEAGSEIFDRAIERDRGFILKRGKKKATNEWKRFVEKVESLRP